MITYRQAIGILIAGLACIALAQILIKWRFNTLGLNGDGFAGGLSAVIRLAIADIWLWLAGVMLIASAITWYTAMTRLPVSLMLPIASIVTPAVAVGAHFFLDEPLDLGKTLAILVTASGVGWLSYQL